MKSREPIMYTRKIKGQQPVIHQQPPGKSNHLQGYQNTKQWVEETSKKCKDTATSGKECQLMLQQPCNSQGAAKRSIVRKHHGVHFKQENRGTHSRLELKALTHVNAVPSPRILQKKCVTESHVAALLPISLNVAASGCQASNSLLTKPSSVLVKTPEDAQDKQGQTSILYQDGHGKNSCFQDLEAKQVVWSNAAFEADDDFKCSKVLDSDTKSSNPLFSTAGCRNLAQIDTTMPLRLHNQSQYWPTPLPFVMSNLKETIFSKNVALNPSKNSSVNVESSPFLLSTSLNSPQANKASLHQIGQMQLEGTGQSSGDWYTPVCVESAPTCSQNRAASVDKAKPKDQKTSSTSASVHPRPQSSLSNDCSSEAGVALSQVSSFLRQGKQLERFGLHIDGVQEFECELEDIKHKTKSAILETALVPKPSITGLYGSWGSNKADSISGLSKTSHFVSHQSRSITPNHNRPLQLKNALFEKAEIEASIEEDIEHKISKEISELTERLAALHAKQECRHIAKCQDPAMARGSGGDTSCPQTPQLTDPSLEHSESVCYQKGMVVAAHFFHSKGEKLKKHGSSKLAGNIQKINESPFTGRPNPPQRSLGTPSCLLMKNPASVRPKSTSPNHNRVLTSDSQCGMDYMNPNVTAKEEEWEKPLLQRASSTSRLGTSGAVSQKTFKDNKKGWNLLATKGGHKDQDFRAKEQRLHWAPCLSTRGLGGAGGTISHGYPEVEQKLDWVKSLRSGSAPSFQPFTLFGKSKNNQALDERFIRQKSEKQDVNAWLNEQMLQSSQSSWAAADDVKGESNVLKDQSEKNNKKKSKSDDNQVPEVGSEVQSAFVWSARTNTGTNFNSPSRNICPSTSNQMSTLDTCLELKTTPSKKGNRIYSSHYKTLVKTTPSKTTPVRTSPGSRSVDLRSPIKNQRGMEFSSPKKFTPGKKFGKDLKDDMKMQKCLRTTHKGCSGAAECIDVNKMWTNKYHNGWVKRSKNQNQSLEASCDYKNSRGGHKITVIGAEYEKFIEDEKTARENPAIHVMPTASTHPNSETNAMDNMLCKRNGLNEGSEQPSSSASEVYNEPPPRKTYIRCFDFIKDKHSIMQMKGKLEQHQFRDQFCSQRMPHHGNDDGLIMLAEDTINEIKADFYATKHLKNEMRSKGQAVEEMQLAEERSRGTYPQDAKNDVQGETNNSSSSIKVSRGPLSERSVAYDNKLGEGHSRPSSSYLPEDYTLDMMLQYVNTLKSERDCLPRIRANKNDVALLGQSPRDSGCIKRTKEGKRSGCCYFGGSGGEGGGPLGGSNQPAAPLDVEALSPSKIEGLDLESFWCLVGEQEGPNLIKCP